MKIRTLKKKLKKKNPEKLQRIWIKHLIEWIKLETEYKSIKKYYIQSCKEKINLWFKQFFDFLTKNHNLVVKVDSSLIFNVKNQNL